MNPLTWTDPPLLIDWLVRAAWQSAGLALVVLLLQLLLGRWIAPRWRYAMWLLVLARLAMPVQVGVTWRSTSIDRPPAMISVAEAPATPSGVIIRTGVGPLPTDLVETRIDATVAPARSAWPIVIAAWLGVAGLIMLLLVARHAWFAIRLRREASASDDATILQSLRDIAGDRRTPRVLLSNHVTGPAVFGVLRPCILLPRETAGQLSAEQLRFVFLHEMAHLRRFDPQIEFIAAMVCGLHWFNPFAWFALQRLRAERELACDEAVLRQTSHESRSAYGHALLSLATAVRPARGTPVLSMASSSTQLKGRIMQIARFNPRPRRNMVAAGLVLVLAGIVVTDAQSADPIATQPAPLPSAPAIKTVPDPVDPVRDADTKEKLQQRIPELRLEKMAFSEVLDLLRDTAKVDLFVNWRTLEAAGVDRNTPVTMRMRNVSVAKALSFALDAASGMTPQLKYVIDEGVVVVSTADDFGRAVETRTYDIRDLIIVIPDFTPPSPTVAQRLASDAQLNRLRTSVSQLEVAIKTSTVGGEHPTMVQFAAQRDAMKEQIATREVQIKEEIEAAEPDAGPTRKQIVDQITSLITDTIEPGTWKENGGQLGSIRELGGQLIVTQSPEAHAQLQQLLSLLRQGRSLQINVETRFITIDAALVPEGSLKSRIEKIEKGEADKQQTWYLTNEEVAALLAEVKAIPDVSTISAPRLTIFNGQRAFVQVMTQHSYTSGVRRDADGGKLEAVIDVAEEGINLDLTGTVSADRKHVTLTVHPKVSKLLRFENVPTTLPADAPAGVQIQRPVIRTQELSTTVSVPDRGTIVLGGLAEPRDGDKPARVLLLLINGTIINQRETEEVPRLK